MPQIRPAPGPYAETPASRPAARPPQPRAGETPAVYTTEQTTPPIEVGTVRGLYAGIALALIGGAEAAVGVLAAGGDARGAIVAGLAAGLSLLGATVGAFRAYGYADQQSATRRA